MASSKRLGFFWGEDKLTLVEFDKNSPLQIAHSPLGSKNDSASPFSSNLTEEIQVTAILKKTLQDHKINSGTFYVSLPMKEIILRSFVIPHLKNEDIPNAIKFEAKRYIPFDIQDLSYVFYTVPFTEGQVKRLQVIFFAARKEVLARYERIFKQVNMQVLHCEPYIVSLAKSLLFRKDIKPTDHLAFLILDKNLGRICFIDKGIPQFIREFPINFPAPEEETDESIEALNLKIVNEAGNSFDFYGRQFTGGPVEQVLVSSEFIQKNLLESLETELKIKITKFSPVISTGAFGQSNDMDAIYAMGACVTPLIDSLGKFNFIGDRLPKAKFENEIFALLKPYKDLVITFLMCVVFLIGVNVFFLMRLQLSQNQFNQLTAKEGAYAKVTLESINTEMQQNIDKLSQYKSVRTSSTMSDIILRLASHLHQGTLLSKISINYNSGDTANPQVTIDIQGMVVNEDPDEQMTTVNRMYEGFKNDKELARFISEVKLVSLNHEEYNGSEVTGFNIHFS